MTHDRGTPNTDLPQFSANVVPAGQIRNQDLVSLLEHYRGGGSEPLIFGDANKPEAAVIPFSAFMRLMKSDHANHILTEHAFQGELSRRVHDAEGRDAAGEAGADVTVEDLAEDLGPVGREWVAERRATRSGQSDHDG